LYKHKIKRGIILLLLLAIAFGVIGCSNKEEGLVAKVDDVGITEDEFNMEFEVYKKINEQQLGEGAMDQLDASTGKTRGEALKEEIMEMLIMERLIEREAEIENISVSPEEVQEIMDEYVEMMGGEEEFDSSLEENSMSRKFFEDNIRRGLLINKHKDNFLDKTNIPQEEIESFFDDNGEDLIVIRASHILVKTEEEGKEVLNRLETGEEFEELALELSADKGSGARGGDLGYFRKGDMIAEFEDAAFKLDVGEVSSLVKTEVGYHIIRLEDKKDSLSSLEEDILYILKEQKYQENLHNLRDEAKVKIF